MTEHGKRPTFYQVLLAGSLLFSLAAALEIFKVPYEAGNLFRSRRWMAGLGLAGLILGAQAVLLWLSQTRHQAVVQERFSAAMKFLQKLGKLNLAVFAAAIAAFAYLVLGSASQPLGSPLLRLFAFWTVAASGAVLINAAGWRWSWIGALAISVLTAAFFYRILAYAPDISTHPLSLGWSETSRYYYASLYFSDQLYGTAVPPSVLHPSRYLMQSVPFLISNSPLWLHRLWQVLLWVTATGLAGFALAWRMKIADPVRFWALTCWAFLFLLIGPVYYHLLIPLIIVLWGYDRRRKWRTLLLVILASAWAGISRINWFPVPGMIAAILYILEEPARQRSFWQYWSKPVFWTLLGTAAAFSAQAVYALLSGNPSEEFTSSLTSDLLWYRLLPNPTYPSGVLLAALVVILPLLALIFTRLKGRWKHVHPLRLLGLAAILGVLLAGGLVVSTKIGGGSNLHNIDAFLALFMIVTASAVFNRVAWEDAAPGAPIQTDASLGLYQSPARRGWLILSILLPVYYAVLFGAPYQIPSQAETQDAISRIERAIERWDPRGENVLFIHERQLVTFQTIQGVRLIPDYEKVYLMEMAMAGNPAYLGQFHNDLKNHRFSIIISEPLYTVTKGASMPFGEENDVWVERVSKPVLCYYESARFIREASIQILIPKAEPGEGCP